MQRMDAAFSCRCCIIVCVLIVPDVALWPQTSALTMNIAGVVKDWLLIGLSVLLYRSPISRVNLGGYSIAFVSVRRFPSPLHSPWSRSAGAAT